MANTIFAVTSQDWIPDAVWLNVLALEAMDAFRGLPDAVVRGDAVWRTWYDQEAPEKAPMPEYDQRLTKFQRMCIVKVSDVPAAPCQRRDGLTVSVFAQRWSTCQHNDFSMLHVDCTVSGPTSGLPRGQDPHLRERLHRGGTGPALPGVGTAEHGARVGREPPQVPAHLPSQRGCALPHAQLPNSLETF